MLAEVATARLPRQSNPVDVSVSILPMSVAVVRVAARSLAPPIVTAMACISRPLSSRVLVLEIECMALEMVLKALLSAIRVVRFMAKPVVLVVGNLSASSRAEVLCIAVILRLMAIILFIVIPQEASALLTASWMHRVLMVLLQPCRVRLSESRVPLMSPVVPESLTAQSIAFLLTALFIVKLVASIALDISVPMAQAPVVVTALELSNMPATPWCLIVPLRHLALMFVGPVFPLGSRNVLVIVVV